MHECLCAWKNLLGNDNWLKREMADGQGSNGNFYGKSFAM